MNVTTRNHKKLLKSTVSIIGIQIAAVALFPAAANAQWAAANGAAKQTTSGAGETLTVTGTDNLAVVGDNAAVATHTGSAVTVNTTGGGISSTGDFSALQITGAGTATAIDVTQGTISSEAVGAGSGTIEISGAASSTAINIGAAGIVTNAATGGDAIYIGGANAFTGSITNAGTISTTNNAGSRGIFVDSANSNLTIANSGTINAGALGTAIFIGSGSTVALSSSAGTITGAVNLGDQAASTFGLTGGTVAGNITMGANGQVLTLNGGQVDGNISGGLGSVLVDNAYTSNGTINVNTLTIATGDSLNASTNNNAITTAGALTIGNGSTLQLGTGALTAGSVVGASAGQGTLRYSGNNSTTGAIGAGTSIAAVTVDNGVTLGMGHNVTATTTTVGTGASGIVNQSAGTLTSALTLNAGSAFTQTGTGSIVGAAVLGSGSTLTIGGSGISSTINGASAGVGALVYTANQTTAAAIGGTNALASTTVNDGVTLSLGHNLTATTLTVGGGTSGAVNQTAGTITANAILGSGSTLTLSGSGVASGNTVQGSSNGNGAVVIGANQSTSGIGNTTRVNSITVNATRNLTLAGNLGATTIANSGTLTMGSTARTITGAYSSTGGTTALSTGAHTSTGNFTTNAASTISTAVNGTTNNASGKITSSGTVSIANGTTVSVDVSGAGGRIARGTTYNIVSGTGAHTGTVSITDNGAGANQYVNFVQNTAATGNLQLFANAVTPFTNLTTTTTTGNANYEAAAAVLENTGSVIPTGNMLTYLNRLDTLFAASDTAGLNAALNEGIVQADSSAQVVSFDALNASAGAVSSRISSLRSGVSSGDGARDRGVWAQAFGTAANQDTRDGIAGFDADTYGFAAGADKAYGNKRLGASVSYANSEVDSRDNLKQTDIDTYQANLYGTYNRGSWFADGLVGGAYHNLDTTRTITAPAAVASGDFNAYSFIGKIDAGYVMPLRRGFDLTPKAGATYGYTNFESYTETGAGTLNLNVDNESASTLRTNIGAELGYTYTGKTYSLRPVLSAAYLHDFGDNSLSTSSSFSGAAGTFRTNGIDMADNGMLLGAGLTLSSYNKFSLVGEYEYELREDYDAHSGMLRARYNF